MPDLNHEADQARHYAEAAALGAMLNGAGEHDRMILEISLMLEPEYFTLGKHRAIFEAIRDELDSNGAVDIITISQRLERKKALEAVGGYRAVAEIAGANPTIANGLHYARIVRDNGRLHLLAAAGHSIAGIGSDPANAPDQASDQAMALLNGASRYDHDEDEVELSEAVAEYINGSPAKRAGDYLIIPTHLKGLNDILEGGFRGGQVAIVAAKTGMGKTSLVTNFAIGAGYKGFNGYLFSPEMNSSEVVSRVVSAQTFVPFRTVHEALEYDEQAQDEITRAAGAMAPIKLRINCKTDLTFSEIMRKASAAKMERGLDYVIIDYIQRLVPPQTEQRWAPTMRAQVGKLSRDLHELAQSLNIVVIAVSQLNRNADQRPGQPRVSDLKETSDLEQDAHTVLLIHQENDGDIVNYGPDVVQSRQIIVAKQRFGRQGVVNVWFDQTIAVFADQDPINIKTA